jgi:hypothetical protein
MPQGVRALLMPFKSDETDDHLEHRMNREYVTTFMPHIADLQRSQHGGNAFILPVDRLLPDQIAALEARGAKEVKAFVRFFVVTNDYMLPRETDSHKDYDLLRFGFFYCLFQQQIVPRQNQSSLVQLAVYVTPNKATIYWHHLHVREIVMPKVPMFPPYSS